MSAELDMSQYLGLFLQEADEQLEILEQETILLEKDPSDERMQAIFRAAHTLKGSSRAMGFVQFADLTHEMENVLDLLRARKLEVTSAIADALLSCLDKLTAAKESIADGNGDQADAGDLILKLRGFCQGTASAAPAGPVLTVIESAPEAPAPAPQSTEFRKVDLRADVVEALKVASADMPVFVAQITVIPDCLMKYVRAFMVINALQDSGELLACDPEREKLEEEEWESTFSLVFAYNGDASEIPAKIKSVGEISQVIVKPFSEDLFGEHTESAPAAQAPAPAPAPQPTAPAEVAPAEAAPVAVAPVAAVPTPSAPTTPAKSAGTGKKTETGQTVRVDVARLDELMNLVGELVIDRTRLSQIGASMASKYDFDDNIEALGEAVSHISRITSDLQDQIMKARMLPIETVLNRFPRMVRDLAQKVNKEIELDLAGGETELDRSVIEVIGDPLLHILRNSIDHGVELPEDREKVGKPRVGKVKVSARHQENHIVIEITDDGRGINAEKVKAKAVETGFITQDVADRMTEKEALQLIFSSGLSTAAQVSEISGRGVGMDIVRSNIQKLGGIIDLETKVGVGTKFSLRLPLTLAIIRGLLVTVDQVIYVLPLGSVIETLLIPVSQIQLVNKKEVVVIRGVTTPIIRLKDVFSKNLEITQEPTEHYVVVVGIAEQRVGLVVDNLVGEQEVVIKSIGQFCGDISGISGATILGNGNVALIVDVNGVIGRGRS